MPIRFRNTTAMLKNMLENNIFFEAGAGAPALLYGAGVTGPGSTYTDVTNKDVYVNIGTLAAPVWAKANNKALTGVISAADIIATGAGKLGHAAGVEIIPAGGAGTVIELLAVLLFYDFLTAAYTAGGNITANYTAGAALTGLVSAANSLAAAGDKAVLLPPLATVGVPLLVNTGISLVSTVAFTNPGTAAGVCRWAAYYRTHASGF